MAAASALRPLERSQYGDSGTRHIIAAPTTSGSVHAASSARQPPSTERMPVPMKIHPPPMARIVARLHTQLIRLSSAPRDAGGQSSAASVSGIIGAPIPSPPTLRRIASTEKLRAGSAIACAAAMTIAAMSVAGRRP